MLTLYPYQRAAVDATYSFMAETGGNPLVVIPTGGGKSLIMGTTIMEAIRDFPDTRIINLAHVPELISQNFQELLGFWPKAPAGIYSAMLGRRQINKQILFAGIQSIHRKAYNLQKVDIVMVDECHLIPRKSDTMYGRFLSDLKQINPNLKVIGYSATPFRMDSGELHKGKNAMFDGVAYDANIRDLIEGGYLSRLISTPAGAQINLEGVKAYSGGDYVPAQLEAAANDPETVNAICNEIVANATGRHSIKVYGAGRTNCEMLRDGLIERGIPSAALFGDTPVAERKSMIEAFKARRLRSLVSLGTLTTGFNAKGIDLIALARATKSTGLYAQIVGRGTRLYPGKDNCLILDFGGNIARHGPIDNLKPAREPKGEGKGDAPIRLCPKCEAECPIGARECDDCGFQFPDVVTLVHTQAAALDIMSRSDLVPDWCDVSRVTYKRHTKNGSPDSVLVTYQCGLLQHREWICLEHTGGAKMKAISWWKRRAGPGVSVPLTVGEALETIDAIAKPRQIAVRPSGKYTEIVGYRHFDNDPQNMKMEAA